MAVNTIYPQGDVVLEVCHDVESFFYLLALLFMQHTDRNHLRGRGYEKLFTSDSNGLAYKNKSLKTGDLPDSSCILAMRNSAANVFLEGYRALCAKSLCTLAVDPALLVEPLTHESLLAVFGKAP